MTFSRMKADDYDYTKYLLQLNGKISTLFKKQSQPIVDIINPFVYHWNIPWYHLIKMAVLSLTLLPIRIVGFLIVFSIAYILSFLIVVSQTEKDREQPLYGWRKNIALPIFLVFARLTYFFASFQWVKVKGKRCSRKDAPILVLAPHSALTDSLLVVFLGMNSVVGKTETANCSVGCFLRLTQPILVRREDPNSRQVAIKEIQRRCQSSDDWPQILIFPEGTCTNRSCLINFKTGAFVPGCPVQPVVIRWPNTVDCTTWTWEGPGIWTLLWMMFTQFHTNVELEFLPIYKPNDEEKRNPKLFADNVRAIMAKTLNVPTTNYSYEDCRHMTLAKKHDLPFADIILEFSRLHKRLINIKQTNTDSLEWIIENTRSKDFNVSIHEFCRRTNIIDCESLAGSVLKFYDKNCSGGVVDVKEFLSHLVLYSFPSNQRTAMVYIMDIYQVHSLDDYSTLTEALKRSFSLTDDQAHELLAVTKSNESKNESFLDILLSIMSALGGPFTIYTNYHNEYLLSVKKSSSSTANNSSCALSSKLVADEYMSEYQQQHTKFE